MIVEDAAQAHGATVAGRSVGSFGIGCFSLYATKNISTGEGGIITTDDDDVADRLRLLRNQGMRARYQYEIAGHNYRLTDLQAALAIPQLHRLDASNARRRSHAARLSAGLDGVTGIVAPVVAAGRTHVFHQYTIRVTAAGAPRSRCACGTTARPWHWHRYLLSPGRVRLRLLPRPSGRGRLGGSRGVPSRPRGALAPCASPPVASDLDRIVDEVRAALGA